MPFVAKAVASVVSVLSVALTSLGTPPSAPASHSQVAIFEDDRHVLGNPSRADHAARPRGRRSSGVYVEWNAIAPAPYGADDAAYFNPSDPASYRASDWAPYDPVVTRGAGPRHRARLRSLDRTGAACGQQAHHQPAGVHFGWW